MTDPNYTHWHLVVDRSGSMDEVKEDAQGGINQAFEEQRKLPGDLTVSLTEFDTVIDSVRRMADIQSVKDYVLVPRGGTALLDAVGRAIAETGEDLASLPEDKRPSKVLIQIVTDGKENSSREWRLPQIKDLIKEQHEKYGWIFAFWGADENAWYGQEMGAQTVTSYAGTKGGTAAAYAATGQSLTGLRSAGSYEAPERVDDPTAP